MEKINYSQLFFEIYHDAEIINAFTELRILLFFNNSCLNLINVLNMTLYLRFIDFHWKF